MIFNDFINKSLPIMTKVTIQANSEIFDDMHIGIFILNLITIMFEHSE